MVKGTFENSRIYPGTWREYWVYVPPGLDRAKQAPVMVFQDGLQYDAPVVFDNLIRKGEIPRMVGVFVMHGRVKASSEAALDRMNRSYEYDSITGEYPRFLLDELLPHVAATHGLTLSADGNDRAIAGNSSGAICAWNAAWQRPDAFRRVFSAIGTYVGIRGGDSIPTSVRKSEPKPIRVFLQDGKNDLDNPHGSWWVANQDMLSALLYAGYDVRHEWGDRRAQLAAREGPLPRRAALLVARLAAAGGSQPGEEVEAALPGPAGAGRGLAAGERGAWAHRRTGGQCEGRVLLRGHGE